MFEYSRSYFLLNFLYQSKIKKTIKCVIIFYYIIVRTYIKGTFLMNFVVNIVNILLTIFVGLGVKNQFILVKTIDF